MPELPEVETIVRELQASIAGDQIISMEIFRSSPIIKGDLDSFQEKLIGSSIKRVDRRAKFLIFHLEPLGYLLVHLRMTGKFIVSIPLSEPTKHQRIWFHLQSGRLLIFEDVRCFGTLEIFEKLEDSKSLASLGIEPLSDDLHVNYLKQRLKNSKREVKSVLLDQKIVVGIGNIYASEILFRSKIHPQRPAGKIKKKEWEDVIENTKFILNEAISKNGTSISDFRRVDDKTGEFQNFLMVYDKTEQPCHVCQAPIQRIKQQQRSSFFCPSCQK